MNAISHRYSGYCPLFGVGAITIKQTWAVYTTTFVEIELPFNAKCRLNFCNFSFIHSSNVWLMKIGVSTRHYLQLFRNCVDSMTSVHLFHLRMNWSIAFSWITKKTYLIESTLDSDSNVSESCDKYLHFINESRELEKKANTLKKKIAWILLCWWCDIKKCK